MTDDDDPDTGRQGTETPSRPLTSAERLLAQRQREKDERDARADRFVSEHGPTLNDHIERVHLIEDKPLRDSTIRALAETLAAKNIELEQIAPDDLNRLINTSLDKAAKQVEPEPSPERDPTTDEPQSPENEPAPEPSQTSDADRSDATKAQWEDASESERGEITDAKATRGQDNGEVSDRQRELLAALREYHAQASETLQARESGHTRGSGGRGR
jgi:hypothetical protein